MKRKILIVFAMGTLMSVFAGKILAQSQEQVEKFKEEQRKYYTEKLELTAQESKDFWPIYDDFLNRKMKLVEDERNTWTYAHKNADNLSDAEILQTQEKAYNLKEKQLELEREYYQDKFLKALPAKKVLMLGKVEWDFRRYLLRELRKDGRDRGSKGGSSDNHPGASGSGNSWAPAPTSECTSAFQFR